MNENPIAVELKAMAARLKELFPESRHITVNAMPSGIDVALHGAGDYSAVTAMMRRIGIGERHKAIFDESSEKPWSVLRGKIDGVHFVGFSSTIPPSCRIEYVAEEVPEYADTGRTTTRTRTVVKCGSAAV